MKYLKTFEDLEYPIAFNEHATYELLHMILDDIEDAWKKNHKIDNWNPKNQKYEKLNYEKIQRLINIGADVNVHDDRNNYGPLLNMAVERKDFKLLKILIENGAEVNQFNSCHSTPLYAASNTDIEMVKYLMKNGADINIPNNSGVLPLHHATFDKKYDIAALLLKSGSILSTKEVGFKGFGSGYGLENWIKDKNYTFQKLLCEMHPDYVAKYIPEEKFHKRIIKEFEYLFYSDKYNL